MKKKNLALQEKKLLKGAFSFVIIMGIVSLCADMVYEGARSVTGPYLYFLGANAAVVGFVSGFGEFLGYALRLITGYLSDKTKQYWTFTIVGYFINLLAVPLLAFVGRWELAAVLILLERTGKAIRTPARDAMLSHATKRIGTGWGFGLHEALDQIGAVSGPLIISIVFFFTKSTPQNYHLAFLTLSIPVLIALSLVIASRFMYANPLGFEPKKLSLENKGLSKPYWIYLLAVSCIAVGYADFPLIAYHLKKTALISMNWIPVFYAAAMGIDGIAALVFGKMFDKLGIRVLQYAAFISIFFAPLAFLGHNVYLALSGVLLWGIGMGAQESIMRSGIAELVSSQTRASAYGIFNTGFGIAWFTGSAIMGMLYDFNVVYLVVFSMLFQLLAIPFFRAIKA